MRNIRPSHRPSRGFTLLEMLVVLVIIGLIASLVGPRLFSRVDTSKVQVAETQVKMLRGALETYRLEVGSFPAASQGLDVLYNPPQDERLRGRWNGPYLDEPAPLDPWGNPYQYSMPGAEGMPFALYSFGADGQRGGEGIDADIGFLPRG
ncbi:type II secretion system major pseudopilin GspG [Arenimonas donghaensis]|nr:type II secretion system major pseudopilin GspG [Arenimonas donghaensis]